MSASNTFHFRVQSKATGKAPVLLARADDDVAFRAAPGVWASLGFLPILLFATNYASEHPVTLALFTAAIMTATTGRLFIVFKRSRFQGKTWRKLLTLVFGFTGLAWGAFVPVTLYLYGHKGIEGLLCVLWLAGSCPNVVSILSPHLTAMRAYLFCAIGPAILGELFLIRDIQPAVAVMFAVLLLYLLEAGNSAHILYWKNLEDSQLLKSRADELELARSEADRANKAKSELLATVTEEIRQPLYDIIGLSAGLLAAELAPEPAEQLRSVKYSADSLLHRVTDLNDLAKLDSGKAEFEKVEFHLQEAIGLTLRSLKPYAEDKGLHLHAHIDAEVPRALVGDPWKVQQLLSILLTNAIQYTERGEVTVDIGLDSWQGKDVSILLLVTDTGPGIDPALKPTLFKPFEGRGLGLPIAAKIASLMGGRVWVESEPGQGAKAYAIFHLQAVELSNRARFRTLPVVA